VYRYYIANGKERRKGLGAFSEGHKGLSLKEARQKAHECYLMVLKGEDPIEVGKLNRRTMSRVRGKTFRECADIYVDSQSAQWSNDKHIQQWRSTLSTYAYPYFGDTPVADVDTALVVQALEAIWLTKTETASRVRQRVEAVLNWATVRKYRDAVENPARWKGHLEHVLPSPSKVKPAVHHAALPYSDLPEFYRWLDEKDSLSARSLQFIILTAARGGEGRGAKWSEIGPALWIIPAARMKARREHRVPLSHAALELIEKLSRDTEFLFPSTGKSGFVSEAALRKLLSEYRSGMTIHGFRSTFRDWCGETTNHQRETAESALAHVIEDATEAAYRRGDMLEKRVALMNDWADFCLGGLIV
jgi:integrase